jgi:hypothetical protein
MPLGVTRVHCGAREVKKRSFVFAWFRKRKKNKNEEEEEVGQRNWDFIARSELITTSHSWGLFWTWTVDAQSLDDVRMNLGVLKCGVTVLFLEPSLPDTSPENSWVSPNATTEEWAVMTAFDPRLSLANVVYIGYGGDPASALHITGRRSEENILQCFVFGPKCAGKYSLLNSLLGGPFSKINSTNGERYAANVVDKLWGSKKTLILWEIPEDGVKKKLSNKEFLAACDVAVFVYASSDAKSWKRSKELLLDVARQGLIFAKPEFFLGDKEDVGGEG